jgi:hypothetical protein
MAMFFAVSVAGIAIRAPILHFLEPVFLGFFQKMGLGVFSPEFLAKNITLAVAIIVVLFWNFFINRFWTYNDVDTVVTTRVVPPSP